MFALDLWQKPDFHEIVPSIDEIHYQAHVLALLELRREKKLGVYYSSLPGMKTAVKLI